MSSGPTDLPRDLDRAGAPPEAGGVFERFIIVSVNNTVHGRKTCRSKTSKINLHVRPCPIYF